MTRAARTHRQEVGLHGHSTGDVHRSTIRRLPAAQLKTARSGSFSLLVSAYYRPNGAVELLGTVSFNVGIGQMGINGRSWDVVLAAPLPSGASQLNARRISLLRKSVG